MPSLLRAPLRGPSSSAKIAHSLLDVGQQYGYPRFPYCQLTGPHRACLKQRSKPWQSGIGFPTSLANASSRAMLGHTAKTSLVRPCGAVSGSRGSRAWSLGQARARARGLLLTNEGLPVGRETRIGQAETDLQSVEGYQLRSADRPTLWGVHRLPPRSSRTVGCSLQTRGANARVQLVHNSHLR